MTDIYRLQEKTNMRVSKFRFTFSGNIPKRFVQVFQHQNMRPFFWLGSSTWNENLLEHLIPWMSLTFSTITDKARDEPYPNIRLNTAVAREYLSHGQVVHIDSKYILTNLGNVRTRNDRISKILGGRFLKNTKIGGNLELFNHNNELVYHGFDLPRTKQDGLHPFHGHANRCCPSHLNMLLRSVHSHDTIARFVCCDPWREFEFLYNSESMKKDEAYWVASALVCSQYFQDSCSSFPGHC